MLKKTTASKPLPPMYIAVDENADSIIVMGTKEQVIEILQDYANDEGWDEDDIECFVMVYELGKQINLQVEKQLEIYF